MRGVRRTTKHGYTTVWLSATVTREWADGNVTPGRWSGSTLRGRRVRVEFDPNGNLVGLTVNGRDNYNVPSNELDAILEDIIGTARPTCEHKNVRPHVSRFGGIFSHYCNDCDRNVFGLE